MEEKIVNYLVNEKNRPKSIAKMSADRICKHDDIAAEFVKWLETRSYDCPNSLVVEGYSAMDIYKLAPFLDGIGIYDFMITLREKPEFAKETLAQGFPRK